MLRQAFILFVTAVLLFISLPGCSSSRSQQTNTDKVKIQTEFTVDNEKIILENKEIIPNKLEILIPKSFSLMSEEMAKNKYPSERRPNIIYTNEKASINVAFNYTQNAFTDKEINTLKRSLKNNLRNLYPSATWYTDEIQVISGRNVGVFELSTPALDTNIYNLMFFFELDGRIMLGTFNCTEKEMENYKPVARSIVKSLKIK